MAAPRWSRSCKRRRSRSATRAAWTCPTCAGVEKLVDAEEAHIGQILRLRAQLEGLVGREPNETLPELRDRAALDIEQKSSALEELGPIAKEARPVSASRSASPRRRAR